MTERELYERAIDEFNERRFFECHDSLEELWGQTRGQRRLFLQGMIQSAVGIFHAGRGNLSGSHSQLSKGLEKLSNYPEQYLGVDVGGFVASIEALLESVKTALAYGPEYFDAGLIPSISYTYDPASMSDFEDELDEQA